MLGNKPERHVGDIKIGRGIGIDGSVWIPDRINIDALAVGGTDMRCIDGRIGIRNRSAIGSDGVEVFGGLNKNAIGGTGGAINTRNDFRHFDQIK